MKNFMVLLCFLLGTSAFAADFKVKIVKKTANGYYVCDNPDKDLPKAWYERKAPSWNCKAIALSDDIEEDLSKSIGRVVTLRGANVEDSVSTSRGGWTIMQIFVRKLID